MDDENFEELLRALELAKKEPADDMIEYTDQNSADPDSPILTEVFDDSDKEWSQQGNIFAPSSKSDKVDTLPPGIYEYKQSMQGWFLEKTRSRFTFPYKVYDTKTGVRTRMMKAWSLLDGNLGVLLNGLRGTGKTVEVQLVANDMVAKGIPVLLVKSVIPSLDTVLARIEQPLMIILDEFEKTHAQTEHQQTLLSAVDGLARNEHKRMFVFTTNKPTLEPNFVDRPSRIRYVWQYNNLDTEVINMLLNDMLLPQRAHYKDDLIAYLKSRVICTIDTVKFAIEEVNKFDESPDQWKDIANLKESAPPAYKIIILDEHGNDIKPWVKRFKPPSNFQGVFSNTTQGVDWIRQRSDIQSPACVISATYPREQLQFVAPGEKPGTWVVNLSVAAKDCWMKPFEFNKLVSWTSFDARYWIDNKPENWTVPLSRTGGKELTETEHEAIDTHFGVYPQTVYGTEENLVNFLVRIEENRDISFTQTHQIASAYDM